MGLGQSERVEREVDMAVTLTVPSDRPAQCLY